MDTVTSHRFDSPTEQFREMLSPVQRSAILAPERALAAEAGGPEPGVTPVEDALSALPEDARAALLDAVVLVATVRAGQVIEEALGKVAERQDGEDLPDEVIAALDEVRDDIDGVRLARVGDW